MGILDYSTNPANNGVIGSTQYWPEGMLPSQVNDTGRQMMADLANWLLTPTFPSTAAITAATVKTFDANERDPYNKADCSLAASVLNANLKAIAGDRYNRSLGYWCETGAYRAKGTVPAQFGGKFPDATAFGPSQ